MPNFPRHIVGGKVIFYLSEVLDWRHRNIKERPRRSPAPALEATATDDGEITLRQAITVTPEQLQDGGVLAIPKLFGDVVDQITGPEWIELARFATVGAGVPMVEAAQGKVRDSAPPGYYSRLFDLAGDKALAVSIRDWEWRWVGLRHPAWQAGILKLFDENSKG